MKTFWPSKLLVRLFVNKAMIADPEDFKVSCIPVVTHNILFFPMWAIASIFFDFKIEGREIARRIKRGPLIVVANHKGYIDPLLVGICFPFLSKGLPVRFITFDSYFKNPFLAAVLKYLGAYPAYIGQGIDRSLAIPSKILQKGATAAFFPEGKRAKTDELYHPKVGVGVLAMRFSEVPILPVAISGTQNIGWFKRPRVRLKVGEPFCLKDRVDLLKERDPLAVANALMAEVEALYNQIASR